MPRYTSLAMSNPPNFFTAFANARIIEAPIFPSSSSSSLLRPPFPLPKTYELKGYKSLLSSDSEVMNFNALSTAWTSDVLADAGAAAAIVISLHEFGPFFVPTNSSPILLLNLKDG
jgi:hypothetical protein